MKFGIDVMPLKVTANYTFYVSVISNTNIVAEQTCEKRRALASLNHTVMNSYRTAKIQILYSNFSRSVAQGA
jgi:hypothetical protein